MKNETLESLPKDADISDIVLKTNTDRHMTMLDQLQSVENFKVMDAFSVDYTIYSALVTLANRAVKNLYNETFAKYDEEIYKLPELGTRNVAEALPKRYEHNDLNKNVQKLVLLNNFYKGRKELLRTHSIEKSHELPFLVAAYSDNIELEEQNTIPQKTRAVLKKLVKSEKSIDDNTSPLELMETITNDSEYGIELVKKAIWNYDDYANIGRVGFLLGLTELNPQELQDRVYGVIGKTHKKWGPFRL